MRREDAPRPRGAGALRRTRRITVPVRRTGETRAWPAGHGTCGTVFVAFALLAGTTGAAACAGHSAAVARRPFWVQGLTLLTALLEWAAVIFFYVALMLPPLVSQP